MTRTGRKKESMADETTTEETEETTSTNADANTSENTEVNEETTEKVEKESEKTDYKAEFEKWKAEAQKWEGRSKGNLKDAEALKSKVAEYEAKANEADELRDQLTAKTTELARLKAALENGLSLEDTSFLTGSTDEEIAESAKKFAARIGAGTSRVPLRTQGAPTDNPRPLSIQDKLRADIAAAREAAK
jgi:hypothetical protein